MVFGDGRFNGTMQNVVGHTLVAMATKFGLGTEIQSPTGSTVFLFYGIQSKTKAINFKQSVVA